MPYPATLGICIYFLVCIGAFFAMSGGPLFLVMLAIVGLGFILTLGGFFADRQRE